MSQIYMFGKLTKKRTVGSERKHIITNWYVTKFIIVSYIEVQGNLLW